MNVLIVESPGKVKAINKYLGSNYKVLASFGHIRDLPSKDGSVKPDDDFAMVWDVDARAQSKIKDIAAAVKGADKLILATDPDREGEAISWHILEVLQRKERCSRTCRSSGWRSTPSPRSAVTGSHRPSAPDQPGTGRRLSGPPRPGLSGRLHPVARAVAQAAGRAFGRPRAVAWRCAWSWSANRRSKPSRPRNIGASMPISPPPSGNFAARLIQLDGKKIEKLSLANEADADRAVSRDQGAELLRRQRRSQAGQAQSLAALQDLDPAAGSRRKLGFNAKRTMQIAQGLYEGVEIGGDTTGLITYMRTDGITMVRRSHHRSPRGDRPEIWRPLCARQRPASMPTTTPRTPRKPMKRCAPPASRARPKKSRAISMRDAAKLYELIWKRAVASQMESAEQERTTVDVMSADKQITLRATGTVTLFDGFLTLYLEGQDDASDEDGSKLPKVAAGDADQGRKASTRRSISPSRRRAIPKPAWSRSWKSWASAALPPMPRSCRPCATAPM